ncbi:hypothetical protein SLA_4794 [Streptomyces laurentii]|uniref:Uncharacterized protein n=1 Tax=Streptomyces laurentii TaxID=39478 RepID=A0A169NWM5_STRLU|nr:hypothetical protein SLA_4794 [Streptomyces laurentii]
MLKLLGFFDDFGYSGETAAGPLGDQVSASGEPDEAESEDARPMNLSIGVGFLGEALVIGYRGLRGGTPFAPEKPSLLDAYTGRGDQSRR